MSERINPLAEQKIHPIVEFFSVDGYALDGISRDFIDLKIVDRRLLQKNLKNAKGIYAFYNSEFEVIYVGKTKSALWEEMKSAFNREMNHYKRYLVKHPRGKFAEPKSGTVRHIRRMNSYLYDSACYFSAYSIIDDDLIDVIELMLIRMLPNDILNVRMEGNTSLKSFSGGS